LEGKGLIRSRRARIVATLGPASVHRVEELVRAGVDVFRLNFSHGERADHERAAAAVRAAEVACARPLAVLADLQGPKLRLGTFKEGKAHWETGARIRLDRDPTPGDAARAPLLNPEVFAAMKPGALLLVDDGRLRLRAEAVGADTLDMRVEQGGPVSNRKGVNAPGVILPMSAMTEKDYKDLNAALDIGVDWVALSFVQRPADMAELKTLLQGRAAALAKIEKPSALAQLEEILDYCDGVMVARGDLGVELEPEEVPVAQKIILRAARRRGVPVVVATQMLDSMVSSPTPTRAEASDVANAVYEGADGLMLSAESAAGQYPVEAVSMMARIIERVEADPLWPGLMDAEHAQASEGDLDALSAAARQAALTIRAGCLVAYTSSGKSARRLARERPLQPVLALTPSLEVARRLALGWGLEPRVVPQPADVSEMADQSCATAVALGLAKPGQKIVIVAGMPFGTPGSTNLLRVATAPRP
jgi:pyruvate kinase